MRKTMISLCLVLAFLPLIGCSKDAEFNAYITEVSSISAEIAKLVDGPDGPAAGVDKAQAYLDSKKAGLQAKYAAIKDARGFQVSQDVMKKYEESSKKAGMDVGSIKVKHADTYESDPAFKTKVDKLINDFVAAATS